jgi:hypothetical protein|nr:MAG TPA: Protein of unknown function (DUF2577) [Caudoviricetes sp.]
MGSSLGEIIKKMAVGANDANAPTSVLFGTVTSVNPLEITVEQKLKLTKEFLVLTKNVKDYTVDVSLDWETENKTLNANHNHTLSGNLSITSTAQVNPNPDNIAVSINNEVTNNLNVEQKNINLLHNHSISGTKKMTIHNGLKLNDNVILLQQQGGNNFVVLDKF